MADIDIIRPSAIPVERSTPASTEVLVIDDGTSVAKSTIRQVVTSGRPTASQAQAVAGTDPFNAMTPLTTKQAFDAQIPQAILDLNLVSANRVGAAITLTSGVPSPQGDVVNATTVYVTPSSGNLIEVYNGSAFVPYPFTQRSIPLNATNYPNATAHWVAAFVQGSTLMVGTFTWSLSNVQIFQGRVVNGSTVSIRNGSNTYSVPAQRATVIGGFFTSGAGTTDNSQSKRYVSNLYQRTTYELVRRNPKTDWLNTAGQQWILADNGNGLNSFAYFQCFDGGLLDVEVSAYVSNSADNLRVVAVGIGIDKTNFDDSTLSEIAPVSYLGAHARARYHGKPGGGHHVVNWLEWGYNTGGEYQTWIGMGHSILGTQKSGMVGTIVN